LGRDLREEEKEALTARALENGVQRTALSFAGHRIGHTETISKILATAALILIWQSPL
jgi:hypothetical protein